MCLHFIDINFLTEAKLTYLNFSYYYKIVLFQDIHPFSIISFKINNYYKISLKRMKGRFVFRA